jgi:hypothetical protein
VELILSYNGGLSWSNTAFQLAKFGACAPAVFAAGRSAASVALGGGAQMLTAFAAGGGGGLTLLRWSVPPREVVDEGGFFVPTHPG